MKNCITIGAWNIEGHKRSKAMIEDLLESFDIDILCISEHKLMSFYANEYKYSFRNHEALLVCDDQWKVLKDVNSETGIRGCGLLYKKCQYFRVRELPYQSTCFCSLEFDTGFKKIYIVSVYFPTVSSSVKESNKELLNTLHHLSVFLKQYKIDSKDLYILGDLNVNEFSKESRTSILRNWMEEWNLRRVYSDYPTHWHHALRRWSHLHGILCHEDDHLEVFTMIEARTGQLRISDHYPILTKIQLEIEEIEEDVGQPEKEEYMGDRWKLDRAKIEGHKFLQIVDINVA